MLLKLIEIIVEDIIVKEIFIFYFERDFDMNIGRDF